MTRTGTKRTIAGHRPRRTPPGSPPGTLVADPGAAKPHISVIAYGPEDLEERSGISVDQIAAVRGDLPVLWINVTGLGDVSIMREVGEFFGLHNLALEDVVNVHQRPKIDAYQDHLFIVCRMPLARQLLETEQVSFFLGRDFVITFQESPGDCFDAVRNRIRARRGRIRNEAADYLLYALLDAVTDGYFPVLEEIGEQIGALEDEIMADPRPEDVRRIHRFKRDLLTVRRAVWPQREMLNSLIRDESPMIGDHTKIYMRDCLDHTFQLIELTETYREIVSDLTDIFLSAQSTRLNEVMKVLTVIATIVMPLTLITGIYGMNFDTRASPWNMPELGWVYGYPAAIAVMLVTAIGMLIYFYRRGWIGRHRRRQSRRRNARST